MDFIDQTRSRAPSPFAALHARYVDILKQLLAAYDLTTETFNLTLKCAGIRGSVYDELKTRPEVINYENNSSLPGEPSKYARRVRVINKILNPGLALTSMSPEEAFKYGADIPGGGKADALLRDLPFVARHLVEYTLLRLLDPEKPVNGIKPKSEAILEALIIPEDKKAPYETTVVFTRDEVKQLKQKMITANILTGHKAALPHIPDDRLVRLPDGAPSSFKSEREKASMARTILREMQPVIGKAKDNSKRLAKFFTFRPEISARHPEHTAQLAEILKPMGIDLPHALDNPGEYKNENGSKIEVRLAPHPRAHLKGVSPTIPKVSVTITEKDAIQLALAPFVDMGATALQEKIRRSAYRLYLKQKAQQTAVSR